MTEESIKIYTTKTLLITPLENLFLLPYQPSSSQEQLQTMYERRRGWQQKIFSARDQQNYASFSLSWTAMEKTSTGQTGIKTNIQL